VRSHQPVSHAAPEVSTKRFLRSFLSPIVVPAGGGNYYMERLIAAARPIQSQRLRRKNQIRKA
jgi:hypothetical protein